MIAQATPALYRSFVDRVSTEPSSVRLLTNLRPLLCVFVVSVKRI